MKVEEIIGRWIFTEEVPLGPGTLRIHSEMSFGRDATVSIHITARAMLDGREIADPNTKDVTYRGRYRAVDQHVIAELPGHAESPMRIAFLSQRQIMTSTGGIFERAENKA